MRFAAQAVCPCGDGPGAVAARWRRSDSLLLVLHGERRDPRDPKGPGNSGGHHHIGVVGTAGVVEVTEKVDLGNTVKGDEVPAYRAWDDT